MVVRVGVTVGAISIHAPVKGATPIRLEMQPALKFQSTLP